ncbi:MAG: hypothetical protein GYA41_12115 [Bacteroidales bacterium]|nr:hypothetical protein [Bacteroidales bacterium]
MMKLRLFFFIIFSGGLLFAGCEKVETGRSFDGFVDDKLRVDATLAFSIDSIRDYRCPSDVVCVWAGDVDIFIRFYKPFGHTDTLMNLYNTSRNPISISGYSFRVNEVLPHPLSTRETPQEDYKINMTITKE